MSSLTVSRMPTHVGRGESQPVARRLLFGVLFVGLWQLLAYLLDNPAKLPSPLQVFEAGVPLTLSGELLGHATISLWRVFLGFTVALVVGVAVGVLTSASRVAWRLLYPPLEMLRPVPAMAMIPIFMAIVGIGELLSVSVVFFAAFFPIMINTQAGVREVNRIFEEAAATLGASRRSIIREVVMPASLPTLFTGVRLGLQFGWMSVVGAEFIGATKGLGFMILFYQKFVATEKVIVGMVLIGILGFLLDRLVLAVQRRLIPWQPR